MDTIGLLKKLKQEKIREQSYSLEGGTPNDKHVLNQRNNGIWEVYYSERGGKFDLEEFNGEDEACEFFLNRILSDSTARNNVSP